MSASTLKPSHARAGMTRSGDGSLQKGVEIPWTKVVQSLSRIYARAREHRQIEVMRGEERLVGDLRARHPRPMSSRERGVVAALATAYAGAAVAMATFLHWNRD